MGANIIRKEKLLRITPKLFRRFFGSQLGEKIYAPDFKVADKFYKYYPDEVRRDTLICLPNIDNDEKLLPNIANILAI